MNIIIIIIIINTSSDKYSIDIGTQVYDRRTKILVVESKWITMKINFNGLSRIIYVSRLQRVITEAVMPDRGASPAKELFFASFEYTRDSPTSRQFGIAAQKSCT